MINQNKLISTIIILFIIPIFLLAQKEKEPIPSSPYVSETTQQVKINGQTISLLTRAGKLEIRNTDNEPIANFGFVSYTKENPEPNRPIVFAYNGGPGSSSFWLHMGVLGPKRIVVNDPDYTPAAPYEIVNNEFSILDIADLVMMDPVGTGISLPVGDAEFKDFWGVDQDISSVSNFITQYLIDYGRMNSPKFLLGESYGTFRNAGVMSYLLNQGIAMNGVIMVSAVFDIRTLMFPPNDDLPYVVHFPTYAATSWYHEKIDKEGRSLEAFLDEVRAFTEKEYSPALFMGDQISSEQKNTISEKLEYYTGIDAAIWEKANLKIKAQEYFQELMKDDGRRVGRLDSRYTGWNQDLISPTDNYDPQSAAISPAYITGFMDYFYNDLGVNKNLRYMVTAGRRDGFKWDWSHAGNYGWGTNIAMNTGIDMASALSKDPNMKVLILNGYYDIATVFYGVEHSINHLELQPEIKDNIIMKYYEAGHMMYTHEPSLVKFKKDVSEFIMDCLK